MTYSLETTNRGRIEAGYFGPFVDRVRFNDTRVPFTLSTSHFVQFVTGLAQGKYAWHLPIVEDETTRAVGRYSPKQKIVSIGYYDVSVDKFGDFADYVFQGGFFGWGSDHPPEWRPDFVVEAREEMQKHLRWHRKESAYLRDAQQKELPRLEDILAEQN